MVTGSGSQVKSPLDGCRAMSAGCGSSAGAASSSGSAILEARAAANACGSGRLPAGRAESGARLVLKSLPAREWTNALSLGVGVGEAPETEAKDTGKVDTFPALHEGAGRLRPPFTDGLAGVSGGAVEGHGVDGGLLGPVANTTTTIERRSGVGVAYGGGECVLIPPHRAQMNARCGKGGRRTTTELTDNVDVQRGDERGMLGGVGEDVPKTTFEQKESSNDALFDVADATKEVNAIYNAIRFSTFTSLTRPNSAARRWVDASGRASPRDGKRALLGITKRLLPRVHRPLCNYEERCAIYFDSKLDPDPLIQDFDACLTAIRNGAFGPLDDMVAKKQLPASIGTVFYVRQDYHDYLAFADYALFWKGDGKFHDCNARGGRFGKLLSRFAAKPLNDRGNWGQQYYTKDNAHHVSFNVVSNAFIPECARYPPGHYHDTANCPTDDMTCEECDLTAADENDMIVSAFQTAFDNEDDADFARRCAQHEQPVVRHDEEPFTRRGILSGSSIKLPVVLVKLNTS
ncbi:hypothetical protein CYMTET_15103 [Cymbomonas tetramitiformis]|uniref:Uncharacterized protein n=1 Tax=Cymbomonas tetramitiformis TaxID=36881 RepID=A0AAE0L9N4_9CHLO|nr:hypothetical protein CYMTET_15103 [Cymbomonas tetramitiformis]